MDFSFSEEQLAIRDTIRELVQDRVAPRAAEIDEKAEYPKDIERLFAENGVMAIPFPERYGGISGSSVTICMGIEEIAKACATSSLILAVQALGSYPILIAGDEEQKSRLCPPLAEGRVCAYALSEPDSGSDAAAMKTTAARYGDEYVLNGSKIFITHGSIADTLIVFARTDRNAGHRGISAFVLEREVSPWETVKLEHKLGIRGSPTAMLAFDDVRVPARNRLGDEGYGFKIALSVLDRSRPGIGAQALGIAEGALDYAVRYAKERRQFGQPVAAFQGIQFMLADMATQIEAARHLVYLAATKVDEHAPDLTKVAAMAKLFASDTAMHVTTDAVQVLGGYGYIRDYPVERMMRDAKITQIYEGTNQIQRVVIGRALLR
ncbi:MAG: acyl-CoA dehydrogenase [Candidatus Nephthysia bennettiae]|uniref:Acyl-CoA dehydrogenase family protein n=1 Tax=Candidatus Nephthysia bennettiae TaxID=3127016 RepID=A0A934KDX4_9BACT|nr:acyl-CoA dehydrogenase family protein [Candidatus Dormibacteraeota bacterium]MBJ7612263.1 acyl-CoA dehydrogenase family protein [Candidatus Dormibacteraeota bacterium]PZR87996.1 MAG: acyl-CoA dehydrogenase [Candidatus Dormibacteraeota bacterium]